MRMDHMLFAQEEYLYCDDPDDETDIPEPPKLTMPDLLEFVRSMGEEAMELRRVEVGMYYTLAFESDEMRDAIEEQVGMIKDLLHGDVRILVEFIGDFFGPAWLYKCTIKKEATGRRVLVEEVPEWPEDWIG